MQPFQLRSHLADRYPLCPLLRAGPQPTVRVRPRRRSEQLTCGVTRPAAGVRHPLDFRIACISALAHTLVLPFDEQQILAGNEATGFDGVD